MKRYLILFIVLGLMSGPIASAEASKKMRKPIRVERIVEGKYGPYPAPVTGCNGVLEPFACLIVPTRTSESFFTAKVTDRHGLPVFAQVKVGGRTITFCGETPEPIAISPGSELHFFLAIPNWPGEMHLDCPASRIKTTGTIRVTLSDHALRHPVHTDSITDPAGSWTPR